MHKPVAPAMDDALVRARARIEATIHQINGHWWNQRKRPDARDLRLLLDATAAADDLRLAGVKEGLEMAAKVARDHRASRDMPVPAIDYDQACDDIAAGIEALGPRP